MRCVCVYVCVSLRRRGFEERLFKKSPRSKMVQEGGRRVRVQWENKGQGRRTGDGRVG
jgi:hypothetical protein